MTTALPTSASHALSSIQDRLSEGLNQGLNELSQRAQQMLASLVARWTSAQRLYTLEGEGGVSELMVESFTAREAVNEPFQIRLQALSLNAHIDLHALLGRRVTLNTTLADGSRSRRSAVVMRAEAMGADGGLARWRLTLQPWMALLAHSSTSRVWQDKTVFQILDDVFAAYANRAAWQWGETDSEGNTEDLQAFVAQGANGGVHSYCVQYRETDLTFAQRLLAQEGLNWRVEEDEDAPAGHRVVISADSARWPQDRTSAGSGGIRFHRASSQEKQDAIQAFGGLRQLMPTATAVLRWDYRQKRAVAAEVPTHHQFGGENIQNMASWLSHYRVASPEADTGEPAGVAAAEHRATLIQQSFEARNKTWLGRSTVRSLRPGTCFELTNSMLDALDELGQDPAQREFAVLSVQHLGINNMPKELSQAIARSLGPAETEDDPFAPPEDTTLDALAHDPELQTQAAASGYANRFEAIRRLIPWRPEHHDAPTALGLQTAIVVGPEGNTTPQGADELYTDALGRIKLQFHWQAAPYADSRPDNRSSCWVRVAQRWAGAGMGVQFIPRIGHEVLVQFLEGDINRPIVVGSLYNGQGEGGIPPTPGGKAAQANLSAYAHSDDHTPSAQGNLMGSGAGGHAPAWHGGAPGTASAGATAQNNAAALSGIKSKEFGGPGFNQLVFDDTPGQLRVQLATTQHATQLNLGYLIHQADNHRGSYRGEGFELRTDAYGAVRAARGLLITSYGINESDPAGDNAPGMALLKQACTLATTFSQAAKTHQTTQAAAAIGSHKTGQSTLSDKAAPLKALHTAVSGMVAGQALDAALSDAASTATAAASGKLPHTTDPIVAVSAKAGLATVAGQDIQWASGEVISWQAGQDLHIAGGEQMRIHTGQSIGILAGAVQPGEGAKGTGLTMIAAQGPVQMQAQAGTAEVAAKGLINIQSANAHIDWAAAKKITLTTEGGAQIVIEGGGITVQCPGKITVRAAQKSFTGADTEKMRRTAMARPSGFYNEAFNVVDEETGQPLVGVRYRLESESGEVIEALTDDHGRTQRLFTSKPEKIKLFLLDN